MDTDLFLTIGIILLALSVPSLLSAWVEQRVPRMGAIMLVASAGMIFAALVYKPGGYNFGEVPTVMLRVLARMMG